MALYAFDGTWNKDEAGEGSDTNVVKFAMAYTEETCYRPGVGTRFGKLGKIFGGVLGAGGGERLDEMLQELAGNFEQGDRTVDIVGFSRGAALALEFANLVNDRMNGAPVRFLGLWTTARLCRKRVKDERGRMTWLSGTIRAKVNFAGRAVGAVLVGPSKREQRGSTRGRVAG